jgi:Domain of unknown function (DUF892)
VEQGQTIDQVVESCGIRLKRVKCVAMEGLIEEGQEQIDEIERGPVLDAALIAAAQKVEHYEIAAYGSLIALAKQLGETHAVTLLLQTLKEEKATDEKLTLLAEEKIAAEALGRSRRAIGIARPDGDSQAAKRARAACFAGVQPQGSFSGVAVLLRVFRQALVRTRQSSGPLPPA